MKSSFFLLFLVVIPRFISTELTIASSQDQLQGKPPDPNSIVRRLDSEINASLEKINQVEQRLQRDLQLRTEIIHTALDSSHPTGRARRLMMKFLQRKHKHEYQKLRNLADDDRSIKGFFNKYLHVIVPTTGIVGSNMIAYFGKWWKESKKLGEVENEEQRSKTELAAKEEEYKLKLDSLNNAATKLAEGFQRLHDSIKANLPPNAL